LKCSAAWARNEVVKLIGTTQLSDNRLNEEVVIDGPEKEIHSRIQA